MKYIFGLSIYICLLLSVIFFPAAADYAVYTTDREPLSGQMEGIPENAGVVTIYVTSVINEKNLQLPSDRGITELIIVPADGMGSISLPEIERICANGVPLVIGQGIGMENASIYGGACVSETETDLASSDLTIEGSVGFVFGGGLATDGGHSGVNETSVTLTKTGLVYFEIFGGGHAYGSGSRASVNSTTLKISGTSDYVLGGGFAEEGGLAECGSTFITAEEGSSVPVALFTGGSASGAGSLSEVESAKALVAGNANWAFSGDFAFGGGKTKLNLASRLEILPSGSTEIAYMGSFSSDEGSDALVNTAELMVCGEASRIVQDSQTADNGKALTQVKALFPCEQGEKAP